MSLLPIINDIQPDLPNTMTCCISAKSLLRCCSDGCQSLGWLEAFHNSKTACLTDWSQFFCCPSNFIFYTHLTGLSPNGEVKQDVFYYIYRQIDKLPPSLMITLNDDHKVRSVHSVVDFKGKRCPRQQNVKTLKKPSLLPCLKLTVRPWKRMVGRWSFPFGARPIFRGHASFRECKICCAKTVRKISIQSPEFPRFQCFGSIFIFCGLSPGLECADFQSKNLPFTQISRFQVCQCCFTNKTWIIYRWFMTICNETHQKTAVNCHKSNEKLAAQTRLSIALMAISFTWYYVKLMFFLLDWSLCACFVFLV